MSTTVGNRLAILCSASISESGVELLASRLAALGIPAAIHATADLGGRSVQRERSKLGEHLAFLRSWRTPGRYLLALGLPRATEDARDVIDLVGDYGSSAALLWERSGHSIPRMCEDLPNITSVRRALTFSEIHRNEILKAAPEVEIFPFSAALPDSLFHWGNFDEPIGGYGMFLGRSASHKGAQTLVDTWEGQVYPQTGLPLRIYLVDVENISRIRFDPNVTWVGHVGNEYERSALIRRATLVAFPATYDHLPQALLEAMASGGLCIATNIPGHSIIEDGHTGRLIQPDLSDLASTVRSVLNDHSSTLAMRKWAVQVCYDQHSAGRARQILSSLFGYLLLD